jgi:hypothetical protein
VSPVPAREPAPGEVLPGVRSACRADLHEVSQRAASWREILLRECGTPVASQATAETRFTSPESYTPKHLAEKILTSKSALEGERKQVTVLFADLKGSMELLTDRDPEEARKILDPVLEFMMETVHRCEDTVNHARHVRGRPTLERLKRRDINHEIAQSTPWSRHRHRPRIRGVVAHRGPAADPARRLHGAHRKVRTAGRLRA